ncbi:virulence RhuM family protein [Methanobacterium formicicum]|uniref:Virulence protein n=1 Tax=Methanobacterium formicicum TaxID=2162 RepID=A0A090I7F6_METFO|nr:virulence RhuM family protein [Methanobacterium formicicum]MDH2658979.1 virulence RhuM family protein [Methanobacterium formicicum]CEA14145.1 virulence protein [Methanobacterium formicicum]
MAEDQKFEKNNIILYKDDEGAATIEVLLKDDTMWSTQKTMAELFDVTAPTINEHLKNIFQTGELDEMSTIRNFLIVQKEGNREVTRKINFYNLDAIIAVGYRVNSKQATQFRIWATNVLNELITKGFVLDDDLLKNGTRFGKDYFDELLEKIREIRASERRFYQKITDIYAQCSFDYNKDAEITRTFYATVQNKLHWAITHHTAAEIISERADSTLKNMGLTTWKNAPEGKILKTDIGVAKDYLSEKEILELNRIVNMYLDYAENQAERHKLMSMEDWASRLDAFLKFNEYDILQNPGKVSHTVAKEIANKEFEKYRKIQDKDYISDFDKEVAKKYLDKKGNGNT